MNEFKNALRNIERSKGRNILIGIIITVIVISITISLSINNAGNKLVATYKNKNALEVTFNLDMNKLRNASSTNKSEFKSLTVDDIKKYTDSKYVKDYYYTLESNLSSNDIKAVDNNKREEENNDNEEHNDRPKMENIGDYKLTAYSNFAYLDDFTNGKKKIISGTMITDKNTNNEIVISENLAEKNNLKVGDTITFYLPNDESKTYNLKIIGIYEETEEDNSSNIMEFNIMTSSNEIYTNVTVLNNILNDNGTNSDNTKFVRNDGLKVKIYLKKNSYLNSFKKEVESKGLSKYYTVSTNEEEITSELKPVKNITNFSKTFLIIVFLIGIIILSVINFLNIKMRKYEIGVYRSIGMSKKSVTLQFLMELLIVSFISFIIGTTIGNILTKPVTNKLLQNEISSYTEKQNSIRENFGGKGFDRPSEMNPNKKSNYKTSLDTKLDSKTIFEIFILVTFITLLSGTVSSITINKYSPNKILRDRS